MMSTETNSAEVWSKTASAYNSAVTQKTAVAARSLIDLVTIVRPIDSTSRVLDLGTGTGAVVLEVARAYPSSSVLATDVSEGMVNVVSQLQIPNVQTQVLDAQEVGNLREESFSHVLSTFMLQFVDDPETVLRGIHNVLEPGGVVGIGLWYEHLPTFTIWEKACKTIDPSYRNGSEFASPKAWTRNEQLKHHMQMAQFADVEVTDIYFPFKFSSAEAYVDFFYYGNNPSTAHVIRQWKGDQKAAVKAVARIVREEYGDGQDLELHAILGVGGKR